jgi:ribosomal protein S20
MAITSSAKRAIRVAARKRVFNLRRLDTMRTNVKDFKKLVIAKKATDAEKSLPQLYKAIDKAEVTTCRHDAQRSTGKVVV